MGLRPCDHCGKFITGRGRRYCSVACFYAHRRAQGKRAVCRNCGREYRPRHGAQQPKFCSPACFEAHRRANPKQYWTRLRQRVQCEGCAREFEKKQSQCRVTSHHFCSRACANRAHSRAVRENPQAYRAGRAAVVCRGCGKTFYIAQYRAATARYCSKACLFIHRFAPKGGENRQNRAGSNNLHTARDNARKRLGEKCLLCGFDIFVETHHIVARRDGGANRIENLSVLCPNHHKMAHLGLIAPAELKRLTLAAIARRSGRLPLFDPHVNGSA
jgi:hypothetical protein